MFIVLGGTGHVGSAVASALLDAGEDVTIVTHDAGAAADWRERGADLAEADVNDVEALRAILRRGTRAFLLNPSADPALDTDAVERRSVAAILAALEGAALEKVVAQSVAGARAGDRIGDLSVLWELEEGLRRQPIPAAINGAAYYFSNWDELLEPVRRTGRLPTMFPADMKLAMVAPDDLGEVAVRRLLSPPDDDGVRCVEGPDRYSPNDVAAAFAKALGRDVEVVVTPPNRWRQAFIDQGFSEAAAEAYSRMTKAAVEQDYAILDGAIKGRITLEQYIGELVAREEPGEND